mmetsp:Transcript_35923/g.82483  ORF Transcript_35923/g.82483 Transcript_35923/m.82483 type:complete len:587 (-) Transcript_35923:90-1850(-)
MLANMAMEAASMRVHIDTCAEEFQASSKPTKLFLGGITRNTTTKHLRDHFSQYGRVLDCIAMRQLDGRPRGFGYVTLGSLEAARRCVVEPQIIDGRVIDVKQAIPEGNAGKDEGMNHMGHGKATSPMGMMPNLAGVDWPCPSVLDQYSPWWPMDCQRQPHSPQQFDCVRMLSRGNADRLAWPTSTEAFDALEILSSTPGSDQVLEQSMSRWAFNDSSMSANAPEFVPGTESSRTSLCSGSDTDALRPAMQAPKKRAPMGDITNLTPASVNLAEGKLGDVLRGAIAAEFDAGSPFSGLSLDTTTFVDVEEKGAAVASPETPATEVPCTSETPVNGLASGSSSSSSSAGSSQSDDGEEEETMDAVNFGEGLADMSALPSLGSAAHLLGQCKRCNFFSKGRCQNGYDCTFCHFPHEKRKPSRQEKRERKAAWLAQQSSQEEDSENGSLLSADEGPIFAAMSVLPKTLMSQSELAEALTPKCFLPEGLALPPGLPLPAKRATSWQPDGEVSPATTCSLGMAAGPTMSDCCLSTTPMGASLTGSMSSIMSAVPGSQVVATASPTQPSVSTVGTQTEAAMVCSKCAVGAALA